MDREAAVLAEYTSLRSEIISDQNRITTLFTFSITIAPTIISIVTVGKVNPFLYLIPLFVILPARFYMDRLDRAVYEKAYYIREQIERHVPDLHWETSRYQASGRTRWTWHGQTISISIIYSAMAALSVILFAYAGAGSLDSATLYTTSLAAGLLSALVCAWLPYHTHHQQSSPEARPVVLSQTAHQGP